MTDLFPISQEVFNAFAREARPEPHHQREALAAAFRALADRLQYKGVISKDGLIAIATELENTNEH